MKWLFSKLMFETRSYQKELIDDLEVFGPDLIQNLKELHTINNLLGGYSISKSGFNSFVKHFPKDTSTIVDAGCGGGDFLNRFYHWSRKKGLEVNLVGLDANQNILNYAKERTRGTKGISLIKQNVLDTWNPGIKPDLVHFSLFLHHLKEEEIVLALKRSFEAGAKGVIINDLHRNPVAYFSIKLLTNLFSRSYLVKNDAPLSVKRGFSRKDWRKILDEFSSYDTYVNWKWAFRWKVMIFEKTKN